MNRSGPLAGIPFCVKAIFEERRLARPRRGACKKRDEKRLAASCPNPMARENYASLPVKNAFSSGGVTTVVIITMTTSADTN